MADYKLARTESRFADMIWEREPIASGELVKLCEQELGWKSTTTYTVLRRLCDRGIFQNENSTVISLISREQFYSLKSRQFVEDTFGGSLPMFLTSFIGGKKLNRKQIESIRKLLDEYQEEPDE